MEPFKNGSHKVLKIRGYHLAQVIFRKEPGFEIEDVFKTHGWKLCNCIHRNKPAEFIAYLEGLYETYGLDAPRDFMAMLRAGDMMRFKGLALPFMMGFITTTIDAPPRAAACAGGRGKAA